MPAVNPAVYLRNIMGLLKASKKPKGFGETVWQKTANGKRQRVEVIRPLSISPPGTPSTSRTTPSTPKTMSSSGRSTPKSRRLIQSPSMLLDSLPGLDTILEDAGFNDFDFGSFNMYGKVSPNILMFVPLSE